VEKFLSQDRRREISKGERTAREIGARDEVKRFQLHFVIHVDFY